MNKKGSILTLKIIGAAVGSAGFIVWLLGNSGITNLLGGGLVGLGTLLLAGGSS